MIQTLITMMQYCIKAFLDIELPIHCIALWFNSNYPLLFSITIIISIDLFLNLSQLFSFFFYIFLFTEKQFPQFINNFPYFNGPNHSMLKFFVVEWGAQAAVGPRYTHLYVQIHIQFLWHYLWEGIRNKKLITTCQMKDSTRE